MSGKNHLIKYIILLLSLLLSNASFAQDEDEAPKAFCVDIDNKKAINLYKKGIDKKKFKKPERLAFLNQCLEMEPDFAEANLAVANEIIVHCLLENKPFTPAVPFFMKAIKACPQIHSEPYYYIGVDFFERYLNDSAARYLNLFIKFKDDNEKKFSKKYDEQLNDAKAIIRTAKKENSLKKNVPFDPKVVKGVSTERDEYLAYISPDNKFCYYIRKMPAKTMDKVYTSDKEREVFYISKRDATGEFNKGDLMYYPFNETEENQGGCTISINNKSLYFAMMRNEGGMQPNVDLYVVDNIGEYVNDSWTEIRKLSPVVNDPKYWDSQPSIASDGVTLYFASDRPGGYGGTDLYVTKKDPKTGQWSVPKNLGPNINTKGNERTPFIHSDSETLYFSSDGHFGFGKFDIFFVRKDEKGEWKEPENIGSPINGASDDLGFFVSSDTKTGYFFSFEDEKVRGRGIGRYDLYSFDLYKEARPQQISFFTGKAEDKDGNPVTGAIVEIKNTVTKEKTYATVDSTTGEFMGVINLEKKDKITITVKKDSMAFNSTLIDVKNVTYEKPPAPIKVKVEKAEKGKSFVINNINYNTNSAEIAEESKIILKSFADYLLENPKIIIEIQGHTDNVGNPKDNDALSSNRAYSVKQFLEECKVSGKRITAKGYGASKPIADNKTEIGKAKNRRTEFLILQD